MLTSEGKQLKEKGKEEGSDHRRRISPRISNLPIVITSCPIAFYTFSSEIGLRSFCFTICSKEIRRKEDTRSQKRKRAYFKQKRRGREKKDCQYPLEIKNTATPSLNPHHRSLLLPTESYTPVMFSFCAWASLLSLRECHHLHYPHPFRYHREPLQEPSRCLS